MRRSQESKRFLLHDMVQAFVKGAAEHRLQLLTEILGVRGSFVSFKRFGILPDFHQREMIMPAVVLQQLETNDTRVVPALRGELLKEFGAVVNVIRSEVNVSDHVELIARSLSMRRDSKWKREQRGEEKLQDARCEFHVGLLQNLFQVQIPIITLSRLFRA